jgi:pyruvate kinase
MRRTKVVATVGPSTADDAAMLSLLGSGTDVVRINAAHTAPERLIEWSARVRRVAASLERSVGVLIDLPGPKLRSGPVRGDIVEVAAGDVFTLSPRELEGDATGVGTTAPDLARWVRVGDEIFLADGQIVLRVEHIRGKDVRCRVVRGGMLRSHKGMHVPRVEANIEPFTAADARALATAVKIKADYIGLSFVRGPDELEFVRARLPKRGAKTQLVAKIETGAALQHMTGIIAAADAVMVARGDLGIQIPARRVPLVQKEIIRRCNEVGKPVITATQMLESMTHSPLPTRAEVNDVANAVIDGSDALMLSEETAVGSYATAAVRTMAEVAESAESWPRDRITPTAAGAGGDRVAWAVAHAAVEAARDLDVAGILCPTHSGMTARRVAAFRPTMPVIATSTSQEVLAGLTLLWGVQALLVDAHAAEDLVHTAMHAARAARIIRKGDMLAVVSASPGRGVGSTDLVRIVRC